MKYDFWKRLLGSSHGYEDASVSEEKIEEGDNAGAYKPGPVGVVVDVGRIKPELGEAEVKNFKGDVLTVGFVSYNELGL